MPGNNMTNANKKNQKHDVRDFMEKIVINAGVGRASQLANFEEKALVQISRDIAAITGQKPQIRKAVKSIAGFKLRQGQVIGLRSTLRRSKMVDFFERLIKIVLPRVRDCNGMDERLIDEEAIDAGGVLNIGLKEQFVFPELSAEESPLTFSLGINIVPKKKDRSAAIEEFRKLGVPLKK
jgi:large subunit ribosomal protein L5